MKNAKASVAFLGLLALLSAGCGVQENQSAGGGAGAQIAPEEINLASMRLGDDGNGESYQVKGEIQNHSKATLAELQVKVSLQDCTEENGCQIIGEQVATVPTDIPAGQSKVFEASTKFKDLPKTKGTLGWHYAVVAAKAK